MKGEEAGEVEADLLKVRSRVGVGVSRGEGERLDVRGGHFTLCIAGLCLTGVKEDC